MLDHARSIVALALSLLIAVPVGARQPTTAPAPPPAPTLDQRLDRFAARLDARREQLHVAGCSVAVVVDGEVVMARGLGLRDVAGALPATDRTLYAIGSTTKAFTSALIAMLVDDGAMAWDDHVRTHLPEFVLRDETANEQVALRDLLCHRTGLMATDILWYAGTAGWEDMHAAIARAEPKDEFRAAFNYQNVGYLAAGRAAGNAAGTTWADLLTERILVPLEMNESNTSVAETLEREDHALGYRWEEPREEDDGWGGDEGEGKGDGAAEGDGWHHVPMRGLDTIAPAGAINSSVRDMASWIRFQLDRGTAGETRLLAAERFDEMWEPQIEVQPGVGYGLGWMVRRAGGRRILEHGGGIDGFSAHVALLPDDGVGLVLLSNANGAAIGGAATPLLLDALFGEWNPDEPDVDPGAMEKYLGAFRFEAMDADLTVLVQNGRLAVDVPGQMVFELHEPGEDGLRKFRGFEMLASVRFNESADGRVDSMTLVQRGLAFDLFRVGATIVPEIDEVEARPFLGRYRLDSIGGEVEVVVQNGRLAVDIPGQTVFELHPPDETGRRVFRATDRIAITFGVDEDGTVTALTLSQNGVDSVAPRLDAPEAAAPLPAVDEVMRLVHDGLGADAWLKVQNLRMTGSATLVNQGVEGTMTILASGFDRYWQRLDLAPFGWMQSSCVGREGWSDSAFEPYEPLEDAMLKQLQLQHPAVLLDLWNVHYEKARVLGREERGGAEVIVVRLEPEDLPASKIFVRVDDGRVVRLESAIRAPGAPDAPIVTTFEDHRPVAGVLFPFRSIIEHPSLGRVVVTVESAETDVEFEREPWFMFPPGSKEHLEMEAIRR